MHDPRLIQVVENLVARLDAAGIAWCVLRNYETFPHPRSDTSDIDFLVACTPRKCLALLQEVVRSEPISIGSVFTKSDGNMKGIFLCLPGQPSLHLDFIQRLSWKGMRVVSEDAVLAASRRHDGVCVPAPGHEVAVSLMGYIFHRGQVKPEYRERIQALATQDQAGFVACLAPVWGNALAEELARRAMAGDWGWFTAWLKTGKRRLFEKQALRPIECLNALGKIGLALAQRMVTPTGVWVAFMGPDGAGKTTVGEAYRARLSTLFDQSHQRQFHWRPRWLPAPGKLAGHAETDIVIDDPHGKPPRGRLVSLLRFGYFWLDFVFGHWVRVRPLLMRRHLVSFDRCYFDFLVDPRRFRLSVPRGLMRLFAHLVPQPELIFVFDAPASVLHARKQELAPAEIEAQLVALRELARRYPAMHTVRVDREVSDIVDELERITLAYLDRRERRRLGWAPVDHRIMGTQQ